MDDGNPILDTPQDSNDKYKKPFLTGVLYVIAFYSAGCGLAGLSYITVGHEYIHGPGLYHIILLFTFAGGACWTILAGLKMLTVHRSAKLNGILLTNTVVLLGVAGFMYTLLHEDRERAYDNRDELKIVRKGDTATVYYNDNLIYMQVKDSVVMNFMDSSDRSREVLEKLEKEIRSGEVNETQRN